MTHPPPTRHPTALSLLATACAFAARPANGDESATTIAVVPDPPGMDRGRSGIDVPWSALGTTAFVLVVLALALTAAYLIERLATAAGERRHRSPPPSILEDRRR